MATPPAMAAGTAKSNMPNCSSPKSLATATTSKLVDVPMVVAMPPTSVAKPIGISTLVAGALARRQALMRIGSKRTTTGVLLTNADSTAPTTSVASKERNGARAQARPSALPTGSSAPVTTIPCPSTINAHTEMSASWPRPKKRSEGSTPS